MWLLVCLRCIDEPIQKRIYYYGGIYYCIACKMTDRYISCELRQVISLHLISQRFGNFPRFPAPLETGNAGMSVSYLLVNCLLVVCVNLRLLYILIVWYFLLALEPIKVYYALRIYSFIIQLVIGVVLVCVVSLLLLLLLSLHIIIYFFFSSS